MPRRRSLGDKARLDRIGCPGFRVCWFLVSGVNCSSVDDVSARFSRILLLWKEEEEDVGSDGGRNPSTLTTNIIINAINGRMRGEDETLILLLLPLAVDCLFAIARKHCRVQ